MEILFFFIILFFVSIPIEPVFSWIFKKVRHINSKLAKPQSYLYMSKVPLMFFTISLYNFAKSYFSLFFFNQFFSSSFGLVVLIIIVLTFHNWPIWQNFENKQHFGFILMGIYFYISPVLGLIYLASFLIYSLLFNSFLIGRFANIISLFFWLLFLNSDFLSHIINLIILGIISLAYQKELSAYFNGKSFSLKKSFSNR